MVAQVGTVGVGIVLTIITGMAGAAGGWGFKVLQDRIDGVEEAAADARIEHRVRELGEAHTETRRLAEAAYTSVHGDEDRPEDIGFIVRAKERRRRLERDVSDLRDAVDRIERLQREHNNRVKEAFRVLDDNIDGDIPDPVVAHGPQEGAE